MTSRNGQARARPPAGSALTFGLPDAPRPRVATAWWARDFAGEAGQVGEVRHWIADLLPECDPLADVLLLASELCANAVVHTHSGQAGGRFSVDVEWSPKLARVVVGDQGSLEIPVAGAGAAGTAWSEESGRGLWLVDAMADDWGTASAPEGRWVWFSVDWQARGGPTLAVPGGADTAIVAIAALLAEFPGTTAWWGHQTGTWRAALPGATGASLVSAPTPVRLCRALAGAYPRLAPPARTAGQRHGPEAGAAGTAGGDSLPPGRAATNARPPGSPHWRTLRERHRNDRRPMCLRVHRARR
jgi:anti-sigma regulatory factor (Ser/Thr protein kinase)